MCVGIETVKEKQDEMAEHIAQIREAVYHPYQGLYARIRELESWKSTSSKMIWLIITTVIALAAASIWRTMLTGT